MLIHQVVGGRLYLFHPEAEDPITRLENQWAGEEATRLPEPSFVWGLDTLGPPRPPIWESKTARPPLGLRLRSRPAPPEAVPQFAAVRLQERVTARPPPEEPVGIGQVARQEQFLRVEQAGALAPGPRGRFLGRTGQVWQVDHQPLFVAEQDAPLTAAVQDRLARGTLAPAPPAAPEARPAARSRLYRTLPVGDTR